MAAIDRRPGRPQRSNVRPRPLQRVRIHVEQREAQRPAGREIEGRAIARRGRHAQHGERLATAFLVAFGGQLQLRCIGGDGEDGLVAVRRQVLDDELAVTAPLVAAFRGKLDA